MCVNALFIFLTDLKQEAEEPEADACKMHFECVQNAENGFSESKILHSSIFVFI